MDLKVTGGFIKEQRKLKNLTQVELAEKLNVSEKTISKWECGKGFPDTDLMLPLCETLGLDANELLSGRKLKADEYKTQAEDNLVLLQADKERSVKMLLTIEIVLGIFTTILGLLAIYLPAIITLPTWATVLVIIGGVLVLAVGLGFCLLIERDAGFYECPHCQDKHIPTYKQMLFAMHMGRTRYMKCPHCHKSGWQKKVIK